jgi:23S rRNA (uracil1939-C5)-methyltransferase
MPPPHEAIELDIVALGGQGDAIGRLSTGPQQGEVVLVPGGCPGDRAKVALRGRLRGVQRGQLLELTRSSAERVAPRCVVAEQCGGCSWQHVAIERQRAEKLAQLQRSLGRDAPVAMWAAEVPAWAQRRRVRLHLRRQAHGLAVGMMARASDEVAATTTCPVLLPELERVLARADAALAPWLAQGELYLVAGQEGVLASLHGQPSGAARVGVQPMAAQLAEHLGVQGLAVQLGRHVDAAGRAEVTLPETAGAYPITVDAEGFCQATAAANTAIRAAVQSSLARIGPLTSAQEYFAGSGNLSALLVGSAAQVRTVELDAAAVARARRSLAGTEVLVERGDAAEAAWRADLWLLDPGRAGARALVERAAHLQPHHVIYVSCALDTLSRDLGILRSSGYRVQSARAVDAFAHTPHLEAIVHLQRPFAAVQG